MRPLVLTLLVATSVPALAADPPVKTDRSGDPLPTGALMRLGTLRNRAPITGFGIEKDGTVVTVGPGADVRRWHAGEDKSSEPAVLPLNGLKPAQNDPQVSPDGRYVAACSHDTVFVWETPTDAKAKPKQVAAFDVSWPGHVCISPDSSKLVVTGGWALHFSIAFEQPLHLCDLKTGKMTDLEGKATSFGSLNFSGDGKRVMAFADGKFVLWDTATAKRVAEFKIDGHSYSKCTLNHSGDLIVAQPFLLREKFEWHFFDAKTGKRRNDLTGPQVGESVTFAPDGKTILVGERTGVLWWDPAAGKLLRRFEGDPSWMPVRFTPDGKTLVATSRHALLLWDAATGKPLFADQNAGHAQNITGLGISPDGKRIATRGWDGRLCLWDANTGAELWRAPADEWTSPRIAFSPDGKFLYAGVPKRNEVLKYDAATGKEVLKLVGDAKQPKQGIVRTIRVAADGKTVCALIGPSEVLQYAQFVRWDATTGERLKTAHIHDRPCNNSDLSPDGEFIALDSHPAVISLAALTVDHIREAKLRSARGLSFSDDGKWLTAVAQPHTPDGVVSRRAVVFSTTTWKEVCSVAVAESGRVALSPDGKTLAVAANEKVEFFDTATSKTIGEYKLSAGTWPSHYHCYTQVLRFTPDGTKLISGHLDTTTLVWLVPERPAK